MISNHILALIEQHLAENVTSLHDQLIKKYPGLTLDVWENKDQLRLQLIKLPKEQRGGGIGTDVMKALMTYADNKNLLMVLSPDTQNGNKLKLIKWYKSLGFVENKGRNRDDSIGGAFELSMYRTPKGMKLWDWWKSIKEMVEFPVSEDPMEKRSRLNRKYTQIVKIDAAKFKQQWEADHNGERLDWNPGRFDRLKNLESINAYPQVYVSTLGKIDVLDGRHRISVAASKGKSIKVATPKKTTIPHDLLVP